MNPPLSPLHIVGLAGQKSAGKSTVAAMLRGYGFHEISLADGIKRFCAELFGVPWQVLWGESKLRDRTVVSVRPVLHAPHALGAVGLVFPDTPAAEVYAKLLQVLEPWTREDRLMTVRELLQQIGTEWGKALDPFVWVHRTYEDCLALATGEFDYHPFVGPIRRPRERVETDLTKPTSIVIPDVRYPKDEGTTVRMIWGGEVWWLDASRRLPEPPEGSHSSEPRAKDFEALRTGVIDRNGEDPEDWRPILKLLQERLGVTTETPPCYRPLFPIPLTAPGGLKPSGWLCPVCGAPGNEWMRWHCQSRPCEGCERKPELHHLYCKTCEVQRGAAREDLRRQNATVLDESSYTDPLYWPDTCHSSMNGDGYFDDLASLYDVCASNDLEPPAYVYACHRMTPSTDARAVIENALSDFHDSALEGVGDATEKELQIRLDEFWEKLGIHGWEPDFSRVILVPPRLPRVPEAPSETPEPHEAILF